MYIPTQTVYSPTYNYMYLLNIINMTDRQTTWSTTCWKATGGGNRKSEPQFNAYTTKRKITN